MGTSAAFIATDHETRNDSKQKHPTRRVRIRTSLRYAPLSDVTDFAADAILQPGVGLARQRRVALILEITAGVSQQKIRSVRRERTEVLKLVYKSRVCRPSDRHGHGKKPVAAICVQHFDVPNALQFTLDIAAGCGLHRSSNRVIHCPESI